MAKLLRQDLLLLAEHWLESARALFQAQLAGAAYHAGGLALECVLKAKIAKDIVAEEFPDKNLAARAWNHDPSNLLALGDLVRVLDQASADVQANWATVKDWSIESRYNLAVNVVTVGAFLDALDNSQDGILVWLRNHC